MIKMKEKILSLIMVFFICICTSCTIPSDADITSSDYASGKSDHVANSWLRYDFEDLRHNIGAIVRAEYVGGVDTGKTDYELEFKVMEVFSGNIEKGNLTVVYVARDSYAINEVSAKPLDEGETEYQVGEEYLLLLYTKNPTPQLLGFGQCIPYNNISSGAVYGFFNENIESYIPEFDFSKGTDAFVEFLLEEKGLKK